MDARLVLMDSTMPRRSEPVHEDKTMSAMVCDYVDSRERFLAGVLELLCQQLELTPTQYDDATAKYEAVGHWLNDGHLLARLGPEVFAQGSIRLGTTVRPLGRDEFDVDLVCWLIGGHDGLRPSLVMRLVGDRLREHRVYRDMLESKNRCWRLNYAGEFHMDITPAVANSGCSNGGLVVPDRELRHWSPTNPRGYAQWFDAQAKVQPVIEHGLREKVRAGVEPLPDQIPFKNILVRAVQLFKRHRDVWFQDRDQEVAPISIIVTTLAARAYVQAVDSRVYGSEFELLLEVIHGLPRHVQTRSIEGRRQFFVGNPTTDGENFAEKWNQHPERAEAFFAWNRAALDDFRRLSETSGADAMRKFLAGRFGDRESRRVMQSVANAVTAARESGHLRVAAGVGLTTGTLGVGVRAHTFYGEQG